MSQPLGAPLTSCRHALCKCCCCAGPRCRGCGVFVRAGQGRIVYCSIWLGGLRKLMGTKGHSRSHPAARDIMEIQDWMECDGRQGAWSSSCECLRVFVPPYRRSPKTRHPCAFRIQGIISAMLANGPPLAWLGYGTQHASC